MATISVPTTSALPPTQLVPTSHPAVNKILYRLSRPSLISLVLDWLDERNLKSNAPYLADPEDGEDDDQDLYPPAQSLEELREIYTELQSRKGAKRDVVDRIIEGDWREGITLYQLAMADMQYLYDHPVSQKWTALKVIRLADEYTSSKPVSIPRFHPSTFLQNLQRESLPDVKAHYNLNRHPSLPITLLRIFVAESPYNTGAALNSRKATFDSSKTFYIAFPDASPYIYVSIPPTVPGQTTRSETVSLRKLLLDAIPKALSKPRERYQLESTTLSAKSLDALLERRGAKGTNSAGGGWGIYAEEKENGGGNPLNGQLPTPEASVDMEEEKKQPLTGIKRVRDEDERVVKRRRSIAKGRFGNSGKIDDGKGIERLDIRIEDPYPVLKEHQTEEDGADQPVEPTAKKQKGRRSTINFGETSNEDDTALEGWRPDIRFTFHGSHIHAGIRDLVEAGIVDGEKMPGWMTGEEGVSIGAVRHGRIRGHKGSGM